jgi:hypothetical protein
MILIAEFVPLSSLGYFTNSLPGIFQPLALLGLLRLQSAFWLSNNYGYNRLDEEDKRHIREDRPLLSSETSLLERGWGYRWWMFRFWWVVSVLSMMGLGLLISLDGLAFSNGPPSVVQVWPSSMVAVKLMYSLLTGGCLMIHLFYLFKASGMSTIIPCIQALWYKLYTYLLIAASLTCLMLSALETKKSAGGGYSTLPAILCSDQTSDCQTVDVSISYNFTSITK